MENIRNVAFIGHSGEGKTSVCEAILFATRVIERMGKVENGSTVMDFDPEEINRKISISLGLASCSYEGTTINLIDTPGFFDFEGEFLTALDIADSAIIVMGPNGSVTVGAEKAIEHCLKNKIPAMIFINQIDKDAADYVGTVEALKTKYKKKIAPIIVPIMEGAKMQGYASLISDKSYIFSPEGRKDIEMPASIEEDFKKLKEVLTESAAGSYDDLMEKYFESIPFTRADIIRGLKKGVMDCDVVPVLCGSATQNKGIINMINQIIRLLPAPEESRNPVYPEGNLALKVFKTISDPFVGRLSYVKVMSGSLKGNPTLTNMNNEKSEKSGGVFIVNGKKLTPTDYLPCGSVGALSKLSFCRTGDTLINGTFKAPFNPIQMPEPVFSMAVSCVKQGEEDKVFGAIAKQIEEDLTLKLEKSTESAETILSGLGETHLDVLVNKIKSKYNVGAVLSTPKIPYRETIKKTVEAEGKHKKQSGGHGQYGHVRIRFEPFDGVFEFAEEVVGGAVPRSYFPAVEKGLTESITKGVLAGYPMTGIRAVLYDGSYHDVDSNELSFKMAANIAYREGCVKADPTILEPIMELRITVHENYLGDVLGDISRRRGRILGTEAEDGKQIITANIPHAEILRYATDLRSMTQGRGKFTVKLSRYEEVPAQNIPAIIAAAKKD